MSSRASVIARVNIVYRLLLLGLDRQLILEHIAEEYPLWGCKQATIDTYIAKSKVLMKKAGEYERPLEFGRSLARKHDLFTRCLDDKDYRTALAVQKEIDDLLGLKEPLRVDIAMARQQLVDLLLEDVLGEADAIARGSAE